MRGRTIKKAHTYSQDHMQLGYFKFSTKEYYVPGPTHLEVQLKYKSTEEAERLTNRCNMHNLTPFECNYTCCDCSQHLTQFRALNK